MRRRPRHLGWHLEFRRPGDAQPALHYYPRTLMPGGRLVVGHGRAYRVRCPLLRADWRITAKPRGRIGRIAFRTQHRVTDPGKYLRFGDRATDEPLLLVAMLAASVAILVHLDEPRVPMPS